MEGLCDDVVAAFLEVLIVSVGGPVEGLLLGLRHCLKLFAVEIDEADELCGLSICHVENID
jgi:hypothetical protein